MKYILVTGGVISGVGKGVLASSLGTLLKAHGMHVTSIKIDPYLNCDAGTFSPYEHGETFVLDDGGEVDLDLGNYERFIDVTLHRDNNITTGKIYQRVIERERRGDYLGKTVQVVPHVTNEIQEWVERVAQLPTDGSDKVPDVCIVELGGTVGDIESMPFVEAFRQFQFRIPRKDFFLIHVSLVPSPSATGEAKTKPTQHSVRDLRGQGLSPNMLVCRSSHPLAAGVCEKLSMFCHVPPSHVLGIHDVASIYHVPLLLEEQGVVAKLAEALELPLNFARNDAGLSVAMTEWRALTERYDQLTKEVKICLVGKYTGLSDAYASVLKALQHASLVAGRKLSVDWVEASLLEPATQTSDPVAYHEAWSKVCSAQGILVPGGFGVRGIEGKIAAVQRAREHKIPFLGICLGLQVAVIEYARNVLGWAGANSTEVEPQNPHPVVIEMPEISTTHLGGTMRLGKRATVFVKPDCVSKKLYGNKDTIEERHRHRYEVNPEKVDALEAAGLQFVGHDVEGRRMEILEIPSHPFFVAVQFHPEFLSRPLRPSPPFVGFVLAACGRLQQFLEDPEHKWLRSA